MINNLKELKIITDKIKLTLQHLSSIFKKGLWIRFIIDFVFIKARYQLTQICVSTTGSITRNIVVILFKAQIYIFLFDCEVANSCWWHCVRVSSKFSQVKHSLQFWLLLLFCWNCNWEFKLRFVILLNANDPAFSQAQIVWLCFNNSAKRGLKGFILHFPFVPSPLCLIHF